MKIRISFMLTVLAAVLMCTAVLTACSKTPAGAESGGGSGAENTLLTDEEAAKIIKTRYQELIDVCSMTSWYESPEDIQTDVIVQELDGGYFCLVDDTFLNHNETLSKLLGNDISYEGVRKTLLSLFSSFSFYTSQELLNCFAEIDGRLWFEACNPENPHPQFINNYFSAELLEIDSVTEDKISFSLGHELFAKEGKNVRVPLELVKSSSGEWVFNETLLNIAAYAGSYWTGIEETADRKVEFSYSYTDSEGEEQTEICSLLVPNRWTFEKKPFGGTFSENGNKILDIAVSPERESESSADGTKELDTKTIGSYEYYVDSYEMNILEWDDAGGDKHFSLYTLNEYTMLANGNRYFFRFFCPADSPVITEDDCNGIISTFIITE